MKPKTIMHEGIATFCDPKCPFFKPSEDPMRKGAFCKKEQKNLPYYDWYLAICKNKFHQQ